MYNYGKPIDFGDWLIDMPDEFSFWIEDQMAMITPLDIVLVAAGLLGIIGLIWFLVTRHAKKNMARLSRSRSSMLSSSILPQEGRHSLRHVHILWQRPRSLSGWQRNMRQKSKDGQQLAKQHLPSFVTQSCSVMGSAALSAAAHRRRV